MGDSRMQPEDWLGLAASTLLLAALCYLATCATARATEHEIRWENADPSRTVGALRVCQLERCVDVAASCGPGERCATVVDLEPGAWPTTGVRVIQSEAPSVTTGTRRRGSFMTRPRIRSCAPHPPHSP